MGSYTPFRLQPSEHLYISALHSDHSLNLVIILDCKNQFWAGNFFLSVLKVCAVVLWPQPCCGALLPKPLWFLCLLKFLPLWNLAFASWCAWLGLVFIDHDKVLCFLKYIKPNLSSRLNKFPYCIRASLVFPPQTTECLPTVYHFILYFLPSHISVFCRSLYSTLS